MERYSVITEKNRREIVLLRAFPCAWGKCSFCDYIEDNGRDEEEMVGNGSFEMEARGGGYLGGGGR